MNGLLNYDDKDDSTGAGNLVESPLFESLRTHLNKWYPTSKEAELEKARNNESGGLTNVP